MTTTEIKVAPDAKALTEEAARRIVAAAEARLADNNHFFSLVLSGGSTPKALYELLASEPYRSQLNWCDYQGQPSISRRSFCALNPRRAPAER